MVASISRQYMKDANLLGFLRRGKVDTAVSVGVSKLPSQAVPRPHGSAAGLLPIWDLFQDDESGLGVVVLKDGSYRCCFEVDGVHVSGFDEIRLVSLMNHLTGFLNSIDTSVQLTIVCHNISKREYFARHPVEVVNDEFLRYFPPFWGTDREFLF